MTLDGFGFGAPLLLLALLAVPALYGLMALVGRRRSRYLVSFTNLDVLVAVSGRGGRWRRRLPLALLGLGVAAAVAALARPHVRTVASVRGATIVLLADVSGSMQATDVHPSRLVAAVHGMRAFLDAVPRGNRVGLLAFSDTVEVVQPPTRDLASVASNLDVLSPQGGTALGTAVEAAVRVVVSSLAADGIRRTADGPLPGAIVVESDGAQDRGVVTPLQAAEMAKAAGVRIYGVAIGTRHGYIAEGVGRLTEAIRALPDPGVMALLARETGGRSFSAKTAAQLDTIYRELGTSVAREPRRTDIAPWFELAAAGLLLAGVAASRALGPVLP